MLSKEDFQTAIRDTIDAYPDLAVRYRAKDPIILQPLDAIATMLAMLSQNIEIAQAEVFEKTRDATVLADAAMRGIVPKAVPAVVEIAVTNGGTTRVDIALGRELIDHRGRPWRVMTGGSVASGATVTLPIEQRWRVTTIKTIAKSEPFHAIEIVSVTDDGQRLAAISVSSADGDWRWADRYVNVGVGERVFHVESDDRQRMYIRFGMTGVVGVQPDADSTVTLRLDYSYGDVTPAPVSALTFKTISSASDALLTLTTGATVTAGKDPHSMETLRAMARYPSVYDRNAVYLGEFDFLLRWHFPELQFLSVWNERVEELARPPEDASNINCLFIACLGPGETDAENTNTYQSLTTTSGDLIAEGAWKATTSTTTRSLRQRIADVVSRADDSYRVVFRKPLLRAYDIRVTATVGSTYNPVSIKEMIGTVLTDQYGRSKVTRGGSAFDTEDLYELFRAQITALADPGSAMVITSSPATTVTIGIAPESWRYAVLDPVTSVLVTASPPPTWNW